MNCELCNRNAGEGRLCRVCAEAVRRVIQIASEPKRARIEPAPEKGNGAAATAGR